MRLPNAVQTILLVLFVLIANTNYAQNETFTMTQVGSNNLLNSAWDLNYGPDNYLWVTEKTTGIVARINPTNGQRDNLIQIADVSSTGGQDGLIGMAIHPELLSTNPYVYVSYTYLAQGQRKQKIVRYTYQINGSDGSLASPFILISNLPASNDHNSGRLIIGSDHKIYYTIGDQGVKVCNSNLAQFLPTQQEINTQNWANYPGKILRLNPDGTIPSDNPEINGVVSHIYTYGHRNPQGLVFGSNGILYSDEHGPSSDDEVNIINPGKNYGWPFVAGVKDNLMYDSDGCLTTETSFTAPNYQDPLLSMFLPNAYKDPACTDSWMCRPNIAPSSIAVYESNAIPNWTNSLLITSLKKGRVYRLKLDANGTAVVGEPIQHFYTPNRYRDIVVSPDGKSIYIITDNSGKTSDASGFNQVSSVQNPGAILKFTVNESLSVENLNADDVFKTWQNSTFNKLYIDIKKSNETNFKAELINPLGQVVKQFTELEAGLNEFNINNAPSGIYILKLYNSNLFLHKQILLN